MVILHLDLDSFFVSVERLHDKSLIGQPVIVGGGVSRGVVASCSYEARKFGVHAGMPLLMAKQKCATAVFVNLHSHLYSKYSHWVSDIIAERAPLMEKASIDEHYVDLSGMDKYFDVLEWAQKIRQRIISETGLPISFGMSVNKTLAKMATNEAKPNGELFIPENKKLDFLSPLSVQKIPGVGAKTLIKLHSLGIKTIADLAHLAPEILQAAFGKYGLKLWKRANGIDQSPVIPYREQKSMSSETTFVSDTSNIDFLKKIIIRLSESLAYELRKKGRLCSVVSIKIRYSDFSTYSMQKRIAYTSLDSKIIDNLMLLFDKLYLKNYKVRLVGVKLDGLIYGVEQLSLFDNSAEQMHLLYAMDWIRDKYGKKAVGRAVSYKLKNNG